MSTTPRKRSTMLIAVGAGVFVVGTALAMVATQSSGAKTTKLSSVTTTTNPPGLVVPPAGVASSFTIPDGQQAISVQVPFVPGVAGYAKAGDFVNVFGAFKSIPADSNPPNPVAKLILPKVKVLAVTTPAPGADTGNAVYLLAVNTADAETVVYLTSFQAVYLSLARDDQPVVGGKGWSLHNAG